MALVTVEQFGDFLKQQFKPEDIPTVQMVVDDASARVRAHCRHKLDPGHAVTESFAYSDPITLGGFPLREIVSITVDDVALTADEWSIDGQELTVLVAGTTVVVEYTYGHNGDLYRVAQNVARRVAARLWSNPLDRSSYTGATGNWQGAPDVTGRLLTPDEKAALAMIADSDVMFT